MIEDGVIKFNHVFLEEIGPLNRNEYAEVEAVRQVLYEKGLIGAYPDGVGYGNLSQRRNLENFYPSKKPQFIILGTQTGGLSQLDGRHYTYVVDYDFLKNQLEVIGPIKASSESLTHASIYESSKSIECVIHIHNKKMWDGLLLSGYPKVPKEVKYGTQEMAAFAAKIVNDSKNKNLLVMEGHEEGVIFWGSSLQETLDLTLEVYQKFL